MQLEVSGVGDGVNSCGGDEGVGGISSSSSGGGDECSVSSGVV